MKFNSQRKDETMKANEIKFGVEVETHVKETNSICNQIGSYRRPLQVSWLPEGWKVGTDSSIAAYNSQGEACMPYQLGRKDAEFVSPILVGEEGLKEAYDSIKDIRDCDWNAKVNKSCGVHVTITFPSDDAAALARLICFFAHHEEGLYATTGTKSRKNGRWAKSLNRSAAHASPKEKTKTAERFAKGDRYHALNLNHLAEGSNRVEFRLFSGSLSPEKIIAWIRLVLAIAEYCLNTDKAVAFSARETKSGKDYAGRGVGHRNLYRILNKLGWLKMKPWGYRGKDYGNEEIEGLPTIKGMVKELVRMAKKYDSDC